ncbi:MAG: IS200/IS605 family transposase [Deltaproteobacteria bacterium CG23_combo_of_CG06-09_8_20_14_all_51_20]|nr:IS200/IS605 family transposase [Deltaproteobacteria bacterium]PIP47410.1 MAG: IS200/IS605 family transposase [Deltaproteobacteria bacterium CG23_combo_of_CG06-09_8_20_14_all_51_20]
MSVYLHKSHNVSVLLYHIVCPANYRRVVFSDDVDDAFRKICLEISERFEIHFLEIGTDKDHVHFLVQSVPRYSPTKIVRKIKSITAREIFCRVPSVKKILWGGEFCSDGYYISTVDKKGNETTSCNYVQKQGSDYQYKQLHREKEVLVTQLKLF